MLEGKRHGFQKTFVEPELIPNARHYSINRAYRPNLESTSKYGFSPDLGEKNGGVLSMRMQVILDSPFARPGSAPMWGGKKGEFRDWTIQRQIATLTEKVDSLKESVNLANHQRAIQGEMRTFPRTWW